MSRPVVLSPNYGFGTLELIGPDGGSEGVIPDWLLEKPQVLAALSILAEQGGKARINRISVSQEMVIDVDGASITVREIVA